MSNDNNKNNNNKDFPGYPHYPKKDDITYGGNSNGSEDLNEENLSVDDDTQELHPKTESSLEDKAAFTEKETNNITNNNSTGSEDDDVQIVMGTEADVTEEDLEMLEDADQNMDTKDDQYLIEDGLDEYDDDGDPLSETDVPGDVSGESLDVPGSELDDDDENLGEEDEENNYYSLGGDNHEGQEENNGDI